MCIRDRFCRDHRQKIVEAQSDAGNPGCSLEEVNTQLLQAWTLAPFSEQEKYKKLAKLDADRYQNDVIMQRWSSDQPLEVDLEIEPQAQQPSTSNNPQPREVILKCKLADDLRRRRIEIDQSSPVSIAQLFKTVRDMYSLPACELQLRWRDEDDDLITLRADSDYKEALDVCFKMDRPLLRLEATLSRFLNLSLIHI
eukprot:TRINITY_DN559_c0_g1_i1.p1 TRINITY_DN559_c0_g1~~TRINITY_DN559_c0_g1_i1.p1  ORF type:complete len:197 (-),score=64.86 TRINITY_DN559_c0_g1_i1:151-741(-)